MEKILVETSAKHIHLSQADLEALFGEGYELTKFKDLSQPGKYAAEEKVTVVGPRSEATMRVLGPVRKESQVELAATDARGLGFKAPVRESGDLDGTPGCVLRGPKGEITIDKEAAKVIRLMFDLAEKRIWPSRIAAYLNKKGYKTAKGLEWDTCGVFRILNREYYVGDVLMQKTYLDADRVRHKNNGEADRYYVRNNHPAIITRKQWDAVQEILDERSEYLAAGRPERKMGGDPHNTYDLTGLLYCPHCGKMLHHRVYNKGKNTSWVCSTKVKKGANCCKGVSVPEKVTEQWNITEPTTVIKKKDKFGQDIYNLIPKAEFEKSRACKYELEESKKIYSHSTYPLSGKLYCGKCGSLMHHNWSWKHEEFWWCGKRVKNGPEACEGVRIPGAIADSWNIDSEVIVYEEVDENGKTSYSYKSK